MKRLVFVAVVVSILAPLAKAEAGGPWRERHRYCPECVREGSRPTGYLSLRIGAFSPDADSEVCGTGLALGGALGGRVNDNLAVEIGMEYAVADIDDRAAYRLDYPADASVSTLGIPLSLKFIVPLAANVELWAGGGLGLYVSRLEFEDPFGEWYTDEDLSDTDIGFHALVGADVALNPGMALTMELRHVETADEHGDDRFLVPDPSGTTAAFGVVFRF